MDETYKKVGNEIEVTKYNEIKTTFKKTDLEKVLNDRKASKELLEKEILYFEKIISECMKMGL